MAKLLSSVLPLAMLACLLVAAIVNGSPANVPSSVKETSQDTPEKPIVPVPKSPPKPPVVASAAPTAKPATTSAAPANTVAPTAANTLTAKPTSSRITNASQNATALHPLKFKGLTIKNSAMGLIIFVVVVAFGYIAFSNWRSSKKRNRLRTYRGARDKMEMAPLGKHADDPEDDTIFDMARA